MRNRSWSSWHSEAVAVDSVRPRRTGSTSTAIGPSTGGDRKWPVTENGSRCGANVSAIARAPIAVEVEPVRRGRTLSTATASLCQDDQERLRMLASYGDLSVVGGPETVTAPPPDLPAPVDCFRGRVRFPGGVPVSIADRFETLIHPDDIGWAHGRPDKHKCGPGCGSPTAVSRTRWPCCWWLTRCRRQCSTWACPAGCLRWR